MEKHTMQDGLIPLSGLSPLVVCRQWGTAMATADGIIHNLVYPIAVNNVRSIIVTHAGDDVAMTAVLSKYVTKSACAIKITDHAYAVNSFACWFLIIGD